MKNAFLGAVISLAAAGALQPAAAAPVTLTGTVSYSGTYTADSIFVAVIDSTSDNLVAVARIPVGPPPYAPSFSLPFDNTGLGALLLAALIDVDNSGFTWTGPGSDPVTPGDIVGWYDGQQEAVYVSSAGSQSGLDFGMPTGEIHGTVTLIGGETEAYIWAATTAFAEGIVSEVEIFSSGPYEIRGVYPGNWIVEGASNLGTVCYGDPTCASPTIVPVAVGQVVTGIDIDFTPLPVASVSWGQVKGLYR